MKILITGGAGFLGSNLCAVLLAQGHSVVVVDNLLTGVRENISEFESMPNFKFIHVGIETPEFVETFNTDISKQRFDEIYHLACPTGVPNIELLGEEMVDASSTGTKNVLKIALKNNAKLVFTSSSEVYGDPQVFPQTEEYTGNVHPQGPRANYEEAKRFSESLVALFVQKYGLDAKTLRLFNVYGPKMSIHDTRVVPRFIQQALLNEPLTVHNNGNQQRTMCHVSDLVDGLQRVMRKGKTGEVYNIGSDEELTMHALAEKIIQLTGSSSKIMFIEGFSHDHKGRKPRLEKIYALGWNMKTNLNDGLLQTVRYFKGKTLSSVGESFATENVIAKNI